MIHKYLRHTGLKVVSIATVFLYVVYDEIAANKKKEKRKIDVGLESIKEVT